MKHKVFLLDDDPSIRDLLTSILESHGYEVYPCETASDAKRMIHENEYSMLLVDIFLPDFNGIEFIREIQESGIRAPIIIITGSSELKHAREAVRLNVFDYLVKPFKTTQFSQVVKNAILQYELEKQKQEIEEQKQRYQQNLEKLVDQKVAELRESEEKYRNLVEQSLVGVYLIQDDVFQYVNKKFCEILKCEAADIIRKKSLSDLAAEENKSLVKTQMDALYEGNEHTSHFEFKVQNEDDYNTVIQVWAASLYHKGKRAVEGIIIDITEQNEARIKEKKYELELLNEHKLAAIGQLAAGIAHNMNTPISIIQGNAELLRLKYPDDGEEIDKILRQTKKMSDLINTILNKGRKEQKTEIVNINLNELLNEELEFLTADLYYKHHIEKDFQLDSSIPKIKGVYSDFSQSIMSFIQNAVDAMYQVPVRRLTIRTQADEQYVHLFIQDTGCGMNKSTKERLFEPFFTTKTQKKAPGIENGFPRGTGLGLSVAYNILKKYNVKIRFSSEENKGTIFELKIPFQTSNSNESEQIPVIES